MVLGQKLGFDHSFLFASHPLLSNTSVAQPMCKENKGGLFARMHPTNCHKVETASQRRRKGTNACFLRPFQATYLRTISIFTPDSGCPHLSDTFFTFQIHKTSQPTHPPAWFSVRVTNVEQNESTAHMLQCQPTPSPGRRCSFNARISHGVKYPHQLLQLQTPPHKIHNLQLLQGGRGGRVNYTK